MEQEKDLESVRGRLFQGILRRVQERYHSDGSDGLGQRFA